MSDDKKKSHFSNQQTIIFMFALSFISALILSLLAAALQKPQEEAKELDRAKEMLVAARIYNNTTRSFQIEKDGQWVEAKEVGNGVLEAGKSETPPSKADILAVVRVRIKPFFVDSTGKRYTVEEAKINLDQYIPENKKRGYGKEPMKIVYEVLSNPVQGESSKATGYVIPVNGFGLWDYIYGYIAIAPNGNDVIGISWYEQKETPGLGANIADAPWQSLFPGKKIFQADSSGKTDYAKTALGITVVRGKVREVLGDAPKAASAVDGMAGATLTGNGVTRAYKETLGPYRPFLMQLASEGEK